MITTVWEPNFKQQSIDYQTQKINTYDQHHSSNRWGQPLSNFQITKCNTVPLHLTPFKVPLVFEKTKIQEYIEQLTFYSHWRNHMLGRVNYISYHLLRKSDSVTGCSKSSWVEMMSRISDERSNLSSSKTGWVQALSLNKGVYFYIHIYSKKILVIYLKFSFTDSITKCSECFVVTSFVTDVCAGSPENQSGTKHNLPALAYRFSCDECHPITESWPYLERLLSLIEQENVLSWILRLFSLNLFSRKKAFFLKKSLTR